MNVQIGVHCSLIISWLWILLMFLTLLSSKGNKKVQKQRNFLKLASDSSSCSGGTTDENSFTFELGWRCSNQAIGTPMKKLLAEEMLSETESKRRSPSVIARLMGLDGLPAHKQQKQSSENCTKRITSVEKASKSRSFYDYRSSRRNSKEQEEFKDVYEVLETSRIESSSCSSLGLTNSKLSDAEMSFIQQKFVDAKGLSIDQKLQDKEYRDELKVPDSNKDRLLKFLQQPDSLFTRHVHDLRVAPPQTHLGCKAAKELSGAHKYESGELGKSARQTLRSPQNHCYGLSNYPYSRYANALNSTETPFEWKDELSPLPTSIVVLKPNIGKAMNGTNCDSSPCSWLASLSDYGVPTEFPSSKNRKGDLWGTKNFPDREGFSSRKSRESRELAREITKKMRSSFRSGSMKISSSGFRGYAVDEGSCGMSGNESEVITVESRNSFGLSDRYKPPSYLLAESSVSREAKKRLSEKWKIAHDSQEPGVVSTGSTLAEMLAIPDNYLTPADLNGMIVADKISDKFFSNDRPNGRVEPLGISSRDGWMDTSIRNLSRSRSLLASSSAFASPKTSMHSETFYDERYLIPKEALRKEKSKRIKGNSGGRHRPSPRKSRSSSKKSHSSSLTVRESKDCLVEVHSSQNQVKHSFEKIDPSEKNVIIFESLVSNDNHKTLVPKNVGEVREENIAIPSETPDGLLLPEISGGKDAISTGGQDILITKEPLMGSSEEGSVSLLHPLPGLESPVSSKEADQPSPVSVMEAPFTDDLSLSYSECFESLSADIQGLRMQLQLLKLESEAFPEEPMLISCDEDAGEGSVLNDKGVCGTEESWQPTYIIDVLNDSGFNDCDPDCDPHTFMSIWHSSECPMAPIVFEELEKKYHVRTPCPRPERRLLFDRINSALLEIHQQFMCSHPWVKPATRVGSKWIIDGFQDHLFVLLAEQEKKLNEDIMGKVLTRESWWMGLGDDIDVIGREIERLLTDELVAEFLAL